MLKMWNNQVAWLSSVILAFGSLRQEDHWEFQASLGCTRLCLHKQTERETAILVLFWEV